MNQPRLLAHVRPDAVPLANKHLNDSVTFFHERSDRIRAIERVVSTMELEVLDALCHHFKPKHWAHTVKSYAGLIEAAEPKGVAEFLNESTLQAPDWPAFIGWYNSATATQQGSADAFMSAFDLELEHLIGRANDSVEVPAGLVASPQLAVFAGRTFCRDETQGDWLREDKFRSRFEIEISFTGAGGNVTRTLGFAGGLNEAIAKAQLELKRVPLTQEFENIDPDPGEPWAYMLTARRIAVRESEKLVAIANITDAGPRPRIEWVLPLSREGLDQAQVQIEQLHAQAREESRADNYFSSWVLRRKAEEIQDVLSVTMSRHAPQLERTIDEVTRKVESYERRTREVETEFSP